MALERITTADGSHSLFNSDLNETYHSIHGAVQESLHIFIHQGLSWYLGMHPGAAVKILEVGFGTALNALLTIGFAQGSKASIEYTTIEAWPIDWQMAATLNYPEQVTMDQAEHYFVALHAAPWNSRQAMLPNLIFEKRLEDLGESVLEYSAYDIIYFDAFAPGKQPEMWDLKILAKIEQCMSPEAIFVTYCAKGQLKRDLKSLGLTVDTLPGPPGKKEMVRATKRG